MNVRLAHGKDLDRIKEIHTSRHNGRWDFPDMSRMLRAIVIELDDDIIGFGMIREISESVMILEPSLSKRNKIKILKEMLLQARIANKFYGHKESYVMVDDSLFESILMRHFGFSDFKGKALIQNV